MAALFWFGETVLHAVAFDPHHFELFPHDDHELWMRTFICVLFILFGLLGESMFRRIEASEARLAAANAELAAALEKAMDGVLPVCAWCKSIRNSEGKWMKLETYIHDYTKAELTHGICEECEAKMEAELLEHHGKRGRSG